MIKHYNFEIFVDSCKDITIKQISSSPDGYDRVHLSRDQVEVFIKSLKSVAASDEKRAGAYDPFSGAV